MDWEAWGGRLGVLVRNLGTMRVVYWVDVSESSGAGSPALSSTEALNGCAIVVKFQYLLGYPNPI